MAETTSGSPEFQKIDLIAFLKDLFYRLRRLWWVLIVTTAVTALAFYLATTTTYTPVYEATATAAVHTVSAATSDNRTTAEQLGSIFPSILTSGALSNVVASDLGLRSVPGTIRFSNISGTNLLTISVTSWDAETAYRILQSVIRNYPAVAQFVVGRTELTVIDDSGIPKDTGRATTIRGSV
ncbi:MAG: hypothetical protein J6Z23_05870, partial [Lachnospiraceae bacterium]|nr:hypothetical protein [Lachnospiraceae bacterium]